MTRTRYITCLFALLACHMVVLAQGGESDTKLSGTPIGSTYSYNNNSGSPSTTVNTCANAFDGDAATYFAAWESNLGWAGLDLGTKHVITRIGFMPRATSSGPRYMQLGIFEGANRADFMDAVPLYLISEVPEANTITYCDVNVSRGFRYVRYIGPTSTRSVVAELEFYGHEGEGDDSKFYQITNIPTLSVHVQNNVVPEVRGEDHEAQSQLIFDDGTMIQDYPILFRVRGNFSSTHPNKAFRMKYNDGKSHHVMNGGRNESPAKCKKWVLINSYRDKTLMRNPVAWAMSRRTEMQWTPWSQVVDLVINGTYWGTYTLADAVSVDPQRINITEMYEDDLDDEAITGGYYVEVDNNAGREPYHFSSSHGNPITVHDPDEDVIQSAQFNYIKNTWNDMEAKVYASNYTDPEDGMRSVLDMETFLRHFLTSEFNGNTDMLCQVFFYKERGDDHFYVGPVWDADLALENDQNTYPANQRMDWTYKVRCTGNWTDFVRRVLSDPAAFAQLQAMWAKLRMKGNFDPSDVAADVDSIREEIRASANLNFIRWPYLNQRLDLNPRVEGTWDGEVDRVKNFVHDRVAWMDEMLSYGTVPQENGVYQIASALELSNFSRIINKNGPKNADAVLLSDIDMSEFNNEFEPIGTALKPYQGIFEGGSHKISNLHVGNEKAQYVGLFGALAGGTQVKNLTIDSTCSFTGSHYIGGLTGRAQRGDVDIRNCGNEADVTASGQRVGAIVGGAYNANVTITNCYNTGNVSGRENVAAFVGWASGDVSVTNSYNAGEVTGATEGLEFTSGTNVNLTQVYDLRYHTQASPITEEQITSGQLCYQLDAQAGVVTWYQNLDNGDTPDTHPILIDSHGSVFWDNGIYTNTNPDGYNYRYYKLDISAIRGDNFLQFAEFDLLDRKANDYSEMTIYAGTKSSVTHEDWPNAADNNTGTKYCSQFNGRAYFLFDAKSEIEIAGYRIYTANDTQSIPNRNPVSWKLYGTNTYTTNPDSSVWELIDERKNDNTLGATNFTPYDFTVKWPKKETTGIETIANTTNTDNAVYDLSGRRVADTIDNARRLPQGIYIVSGKKIMIK